MSQTKAQLIDPVDGSLVNADINASAAIAGTKISPDFGSQAVATTGALSCFAATISGDNQDSLNFTGTSTNANRGIAFNSKTALSHSNDSALRINNNAEFSSVNIFAVDNATSAFTLNQGSNEYITVDTNNSNELITLGNTTTNPKTAILGGAVGIGTTSPTSSLHVSVGSSGTNSSAGFNEFCIEGADEDIGMCFLSPAANNRTHTIAFGDSNNNNAGKIQYNHSTDDLTLTASDNIILSGDAVGIGTTSPSAALHIEAGGNNLRLTRSSFDAMQFGIGTVSNIHGLHLSNITDNNTPISIS